MLGHYGKLWKYVSWNIRTWSCSFSFYTRYNMASSLKKEKSKIRFRSFNWYQYVVNVRGKRYQERRNMSFYLWICDIYGYVICYLWIFMDKLMKTYDKNKESSNLNYWDVINLHGWAVSQKLPLNDFKWI